MVDEKMSQSAVCHNICCHNKTEKDCINQSFLQYCPIVLRGKIVPANF